MDIRYAVAGGSQLERWANSGAEMGECFAGLLFDFDSRITTTTAVVTTAITTATATTATIPIPTRRSREMERAGVGLPAFGFWVGAM